MPKTKSRTKTATPASAQHTQRLRDAVAVLAEQEAEAKRQADDYARQQLSAVVVRSAQARAVELRERLREANEALFLAESGADGAGAAGVVDQVHAHEQAQVHAHEQAQVHAHEQAQAQAQATVDVVDVYTIADNAPLCAERRALVEKLDALRRRKPIALERANALRGVLPDLQRKAHDAPLLEQMRIPLAQGDTVVEVQRRYQMAQAELSELEREVTRLETLERTLPARLEQMAGTAQRMSELAAEHAHKVAHVQAERDAIVAETHRAAAVFVTALAKAGRWNWEHRLLTTDSGELPTLGSYSNPVRVAADAIVAPITIDECQPAASYWRSIPTLPALPDDFAADVAVWGRAQKEDDDDAR